MRGPKINMAAEQLEFANKIDKRYIFEEENQ